MCNARLLIQTIWMLCGIVMLLTGCAVTYGDHNASQIARTTKQPCEEKPPHVYVFFEGETVDFRYEKVGLVEATGKEDVKTQTVLDHLKYEAWQNCADGIIQVKKEYRYDEVNTSDDNGGTTSRSVILSGIAVKIKQDSTFLANYRNQADASFIVEAEANQQQMNRKTSNQKILLGVVTAIGLLFTIAFIASN